MTQDVDGERKLPTLRTLFAVRDPIGLQQKIGDEMFQRERQNEGAETPKRNGEINLRHRRIQNDGEGYKAPTILILQLILQMSRADNGTQAFRQRPRRILRQGIHVRLAKQGEVDRAILEPRISQEKRR